MDPASTVYADVGGMAFFDALVDRFYDGVENDQALRPMYPDDLEPGKRALALFLAQYWGGPTTYSDAKGHPRLRMRHVSFAIGQAERDAWLTHMLAALAEAEIDPEIDQQMQAYFAMAADHLVNTES